MIDATEAIKKLADDHCNQLLEQLNVEKLRKNKRTETVKRGLEQHSKALYDFLQYCQVTSNNLGYKL